MQFKLPETFARIGERSNDKSLLVFSFLLLIPLTYSNHVIAETNPPLDLIELLGEMGDDNNMLEVALAELEQGAGGTPQNQDNKQSRKQNSDTAIPAGGSKK